MAGIVAIAVGITAGLASDFADSSWHFSKQKEMKEKLDAVIQAFKEDLEEHISLQDLLDDRDLGEFDFSIGLVSGIRHYSGKGRQELRYLIKRVLPSLRDIQDQDAKKLLDEKNSHDSKDTMSLRACLLVCKELLISPTSKSAALATVRSVLNMEFCKIGTFLAGASLLFDLVKLTEIIQHKSPGKKLLIIADEISSLPSEDLHLMQSSSGGEEQVGLPEPVVDLLTTLIHSPRRKTDGPDEPGEQDQEGAIEIPGHPDQGDKDQGPALCTSTRQAVEFIDGILGDLNQLLEDENDGDSLFGKTPS